MSNHEDKSLRKRKALNEKNKSTRKRRLQNISILIPSEMFTLIFSSISADEIAVCCSVSRSWNEMFPKDLKELLWTNKSSTVWERIKNNFKDYWLFRNGAHRSEIEHIERKLQVVFPLSVKSCLTVCSGVASNEFGPYWAGGAEEDWSRLPLISPKHYTIPVKSNLHPISDWYKISREGAKGHIVIGGRIDNSKSNTLIVLNPNSWTVGTFVEVWDHCDDLNLNLVDWVDRNYLTEESFKKWKEAR